jgi:hypothetical protein
MLGQFLEFSVHAPSIASSLSFYRQLGWKDFRVGDILHGPYAVIGDRDVAVGLQQREPPDPVLTFVRPELASYLRAFKRCGVDLSFVRVGDDQFHEAGFTDPEGRLVKLLEARTSLPPAWTQDCVTACGRFLEFSLASRSADDDAQFWQRLGFERIAEGREPQRWIRLQGGGAVLGLHEQPRLASGITFRCTSLDARLAYLQAKGIAVASGAPFAAERNRAATLTAPEGTPIYLLDEDTVQAG